MTKNNEDRDRTVDEKVEEEEVKTKETVEEKEEELEPIELEAGSDEEEADLADELAKAEERYVRLYAEFQNFKRRTQEDRANIYARANEELCTNLLTVIDNFERALEHETSEDIEAYHEGMKLIFKQFMDVLKAAGLEEIPAEGEEFDPNIHHAVLAVEGDEENSNKVAEVLKKGYKLNGKVIRASMVKVYS